MEGWARQCCWPPASDFRAATLLDVLPAGTCILLRGHDQVSWVGLLAGTWAPGLAHRESDKGGQERGSRKDRRGRQPPPDTLLYEGVPFLALQKLVTFGSLCPPMHLTQSCLLPIPGLQGLSGLPHLLGHCHVLQPGHLYCECTPPSCLCCTCCLRRLFHRVCDCTPAASGTCFTGCA